MTTIDQDLGRALALLRERGPMSARELGLALDPNAGPMRARLRGSEVLRRLRAAGAAHVESGIGSRSRPFLWISTVGPQELAKPTPAGSEDELC